MGVIRRRGAHAEWWTPPGGALTHPFPVRRGGGALEKRRRDRGGGASYRGEGVSSKKREGFSGLITRGGDESTDQSGPSKNSPIRDAGEKPGEAVRKLSK